MALRDIGDPYLVFIRAVWTIKFILWYNNGKPYSVTAAQTESRHKVRELTQ